MNEFADWTLFQWIVVALLVVNVILTYTTTSFIARLIRWTYQRLSEKD